MVRVFRKPANKGGAGGAGGGGGEEERWRGGEWAPRPGAWRAWWLRSLADAVRGAAAHPPSPPPLVLIGHAASLTPY